MRILSRLEFNGDVNFHVQCDKCKEVVKVLVVAAFVKLDGQGQVSLEESNRLREYSEACFKETHQCSAA